MQTIMVGRPDKAGTKVFHYLEKISKLCEKSGYEVIRVPFSEGFDYRLPGGDKTRTALYAKWQRAERKAHSGCKY